MNQPVLKKKCQRLIQEVSKEILSWLRIAEIIDEDFTFEEKLIQTEVL